MQSRRQGAIAASVWKLQATSGFEYFDFTVSRSWKTSSTGKEGYSSSFFVRNADELHAVIQEAADWIESQQASLLESNDFKKQNMLQEAASFSTTTLKHRGSSKDQIRESRDLRS